MNRLFAPVAIAIAVAAVIVLALPDPSLAGPLNDIGKNLQTEAGGALAKIFTLAFGVAAVLLFWQRQYPGMVVMFFVACFCAYLVLAPASAGALMKDTAESIFP